MTLAALDATLRLYLHPEKLAQRLPTLRLLTRQASDINEQAQRLRPALETRYGDEFQIDVMPCLSQIGSGSLPVDRLPGAALTFTPRDGAAAAWRRSPPAGVACRCRLSGAWATGGYGSIYAALKMRQD